MTEIPKIVGQRLRAVAAVGEHPDPNLLGALVEKVLPRREQVRVLEHVSQCASCREIVLLTATQPSITDVVSTVPVRTGWLAGPVLRWAAAAACIVVVGAVVTFHHAAESRVGTQLSALSTPKAKNAEAQAAVAAEQKTILAGNSAAASAPVEMADGRAGVRLDQLVPGRAKRAESQDSVAGKEIRGSGNAPVEGENAAIVPLVSTNLPPRWTLTADGMLQRSRDSGRTWQTVSVPSQTMLRALAANGMDIWVGGAHGALFHSSDAGRHWTQVHPVVDGEALTADIIGVEFPDALHGKLTLADPEAQALNRRWQPGQTLPQYDFSADSSGGDLEVQKTPAPIFSAGQAWTTADAGHTWQKQ